MRGIKQVGKPNRKRSEIKALDIALTAVQKDSKKKALLVLADAGTAEIGRKLFKDGVLVASIPADPNYNWIDDNYDELQSFERIAMLTRATDGRYKIADRLGFDRTVFIDPELAGNDIEFSINQGISFAPNEVKTTSEFNEPICKLLNPNAAELPGVSTPYAALNNVIRAHVGEVVGIAANNAAGKSTWSSTLISHIVMNEKKHVFWASFEMPSDVALARLYASMTTKKINGMSRNCKDWMDNKSAYLSPADAVTMNDKMDGKLIVYDCETSVTIDELMQRMEYSRRKYNAKVFFIDSLMKVVSSKNFELQGIFLNRLTDWARINKVIVFIIMHLRKGESIGNNRDSELLKPSKQMVSGDNDILNACANVLLLWKNKPKYLSLKNLWDAYHYCNETNIRLKIDEKKYCAWSETDQTLSEAKSIDPETGAERPSEKEIAIINIQNMIAAAEGIYDTLIVVAKNRNRGLDDIEIPLWYDGDYFRWSESKNGNTCRTYEWMLEDKSESVTTHDGTEYVIIQDEIQF